MTVAPGSLFRQWSDWLPFPDPAKGESITAPFGPGCYETRHGEQLVCYGKGRGVAHRMSSLLPEGTGTRNNMLKRKYISKHRAVIEYRTIPFATEAEAVAFENTLKAKAQAQSGLYLFPT